MKHAKITINDDRTGKVIIVDEDAIEHDISGAVSSLTVERTPDGACTATLVMPWASGSFLAEAAHVPVETAAALVALGWTPPLPPRSIDTPAGEIR